MPSRCQSQFFVFRKRGRPKLISPLTELSAALPAMKRRNEMITKQDKRLYIDTLHLSEDMFVNLDPKAKWMCKDGVRSTRRSRGWPDKQLLQWRTAPYGRRYVHLK